jgi:hypothetical protein
MTFRDRDFARGRATMDWGGQGDGYRGQSSRQDQFERQGRFGGWNDEEQYSYDEPQFRGQERYGGTHGGRYGQGGYGQDYGRQATGWQESSYGGQQFGQSGWERDSMGGPGYRGEREFGGSSAGSFGGQGYGQRGFESAGGWQPNAPQGWGNQGRTRGGSWDQNESWEQGRSGRGRWGQGYSDEGMTGQGQQGGQRFGGQGYGSQGRSGGGGGTFYYEEVGLIPGPHSGRGPRGYQRNDQRIEEDISERLTQHGQIDAEDIEVQVRNGEVTLTGTVESRQAKRMAEDLIDSVSGVKDIHNQLRVQQRKGQGQGRSDQDQIIDQTQMGDGRGGSTSKRGQSQSRNQSRDAETAGAEASGS